ncbi:MAG: NRAMP family divalent metal transporter [Ilumatobacteraceae bacterium]
MTESAEAGPVEGSAAASRSGLSGRGNGGWGRYARALGPGLITGASDDDPSGVATCAQAGARFGFGMLWASLLTFPLMAAVQEICDRTALATGQSLGGLIARRFTHRWRIAIGALIIVLCGANALNIAADLVAIGEGVHLLNAGPTTLWAVIAGLTILGLLVKFSYQVIARVFRLLCLALLSYVGVLFAVHLDWPTVLAHTMIPHIQFTKGYLTLLIAVLGTTISPYLFFWQTTNRVDEMREEDIGGASAVPLRRRLRSAAKSKLRLSRFDVFFGMAFSNFVMFAIIAATAATLGANGSVDISSAAEAATALRPVAGHLASMLFALGFIGSGMLAVPVLAGAGASGISGLLGKPTGFTNSIRQAPVFYGLVIVGTVAGTAFSAAGIDPIKLLVLVAVINGIAASPFLLIVMLVSGNRAIMGEQTNRRLSTTLGWLTFTVMAAAAVMLALTSRS